MSPERGYEATSTIPCNDPHSFATKAASGFVLFSMTVRCNRPEDHLREDLERKWPEGEGEGAMRRKGGFYLTRFPVHAPVHRDAAGHEWTDPGWEHPPGGE